MVVGIQPEAGREHGEVVPHDDDQRQHEHPSEHGGAEVTISTKLVQVDGRRVTFEAAVADGADAVAHGTHERFIVDVQKVRERLLKKKAQRG